MALVVVLYSGHGPDDVPTTQGAAASPVAPFPSCNIGPMHHAHLILPIADTEASCLKDSARFMLSHGATFFCPHTWDVKLLVHIVEDDARATFCKSFFDAVAAGVTATHAFRPTLEQGGLPAEALGQLKTWKSEWIYWVHEFGKDNDAGPGAGWNTTTIRSEPTTVVIEQVLYSRQFDLQPSPAHLTYLAHAPLDGKKIVLSHYISTSGASGFDHLLTVHMRRHDGIPLELRPSWPLYLTFPDKKDHWNSKLTTGESYDAELHVYDTKTLLPKTVAVEVTVDLDYYSGQSDGFAGFATMCPSGHPRSPSVCMPLPRQ